VKTHPNATNLPIRFSWQLSDSSTRLCSTLAQLAHDINKIIQLTLNVNTVMQTGLESVEWKKTTDI